MTSGCDATHTIYCEPALRKEGKKEERKEGRKEGGKEGRKERRKEGRKEGRKEEGRKEGRKQGRKEGRKDGLWWTWILINHNWQSNVYTLLNLVDPKLAVNEFIPS